jgi:DNA modification methylase
VSDTFAALHPVGLRPYYEQDGITIYHADCAQVLPFLDPVDLLLTDPPYGIGASSGVGKYGALKWGGGGKRYQVGRGNATRVDVSSND